VSFTHSPGLAFDRRPWPLTNTNAQDFQWFKMNLRFLDCFGALNPLRIAHKKSTFKRVCLKMGFSISFRKCLNNGNWCRSEILPGTSPRQEQCLELIFTNFGLAFKKLWAMNNEAAKFSKTQLTALSYEY